MHARVAWTAAVAIGTLGLAAGPARAQRAQGFYIGAGAGLSLVDSQPNTLDALMGVTPTRIASKPVGFRGGVAAVASAGYALGNGLRVEIEGNYRDNTQGHAGDETKFGGFVNGAYDIDAGLSWLFPYVGLGVGYERDQWHDIMVGDAAGAFAPWSVKGATGNVAIQAIAGVAVPIAAVPGLAVTTEYRYLYVPGAKSFNGTQAAAATPVAARVKTTGESSHTVLVGMRYTFAVPASPEPAPADGEAAPVPGPSAPAPARTYVVYFDWNKASLDARARDIIAEAARASARIAHTRIEVSGYADRTGTARRNALLSRQRAEAVADELVRWGIARAVIDIHAFGAEQLAVPTAAGVREPRNRRVEIVYQ